MALSSYRPSCSSSAANPGNRSRRLSANRLSKTKVAPIAGLLLHNNRAGRDRTSLHHIWTRSPTRSQPRNLLSMASLLELAIIGDNQPRLEQAPLRECAASLSETP